MEQCYLHLRWYFFVSHLVRHLVYLHVGHHVHIHVGHYVSHHVGHHNVVLALCEVSETDSMTKFGADLRMDGVVARDACASKRFVKIDIAQKAIIMIMITIIQKSSLMLWLIILPDEFYLWKTTGCRWNVCIDLVCLPSSEQTHRGTTR